MKILHLTLKKKWFDMIASGEKKEEYRELKDYWYTRLYHWEHRERNSYASHRVYTDAKQFDIVRFKNGYASDAATMDIEFLGTHVGIGKQEWGAPPESFVIKLGKIISQSPF